MNASTLIISWQCPDCLHDNRNDGVRCAGCGSRLTPKRRVMAWLTDTTGPTWLLLVKVFVVMLVYAVAYPLMFAVQVWIALSMLDWFGLLPW